MLKTFVEKYGLLLIRIIVVIAGILFIAIGIERDEQTITLMRAIYICLECIGIG